MNNTNEVHVERCSEQFVPRSNNERFCASLIQEILYARTKDQ